ncbi:MAG TPA: TfoX/Sxy family protein, partial [Thermomicrobiales bacterium]
VAPAIQAYVEEHLLHWPGVTKRKIFGHDGYFIEGRLFAFIGDDGIVLKPPADEKAAVRAFDGAGGWSPDPGADRTKANWIEVPCADEDAVERLLPYLAHAMTFIRTAPQTGWQAERRRKRNEKKGMTVAE